MHATGERIRMTKGYRGIPGTIRGTLQSRFEFYIVELDNGIHIVVGPSGFEPETKTA
jgi:hypothetical protein